MRKRSGRKNQSRDFATRANPVAKNMEKFNRPSTQIDRKKEAKKNGDLNYDES